MEREDMVAPRLAAGEVMTSIERLRAAMENPSIYPALLAVVDVAREQLDYPHYIEERDAYYRIDMPDLREALEALDAAIDAHLEVPRE